MKTRIFVQALLCQMIVFCVSFTELLLATDMD